MDIFSTLGKALSGGLEAIGQGIASEQMGPDWRKKAEMLGRLNEIELQVRGQQPEIQRMQAESMAYNRRALEDAARERARQDKIGRITGLFLGGKAPDPALLEGLDPADIASAQGAAEFERFKAQPMVPQQKMRTITPEQASFYGIQPGDHPEEYINDIAQRKNAEAGRAATNDRFWGMPVQVKRRDPNNPTKTIVTYVPREQLRSGDEVVSFDAPLSAGQVSDVQDVDKALQQIQSLKFRYKPDYVGPVAARAYAIQEKTPFLPVDRDRSEFVAENTTLKNAVIKLITGAQMSEPEAKRIMEQIPAPEDRPEVWEAKYKSSARNAEIMSQVVKGSLGINDARKMLVGIDGSPLFAPGELGDQPNIDVERNRELLGTPKRKRYNPETGMVE